MRNRREERGQRRQHRRDFGIQVFGEKLRQKGERRKRKTEEENPDLASRFWGNREGQGGARISYREKDMGKETDQIQDKKGGRRCKTCGDLKRHGISDTTE